MNLDHVYEKLVNDETPFNHQLDFSLHMCFLCT